jgi:hypothetical protein
MAQIGDCFQDAGIFQGIEGFLIHRCQFTINAYQRLSKKGGCATHENYRVELDLVPAQVLQKTGENENSGYNPSILFF